MKNESFERTERNFNRAFKAVVALWVFWMLFCVSAFGLLIYALIHFIQKYW